jgi:hypothetical protein
MFKKLGAGCTIFLGTCVNGVGAQDEELTSQRTPILRKVKTMITVFQALILLAEKNNLDIKTKALYLSGVRSLSDTLLLNSLLLDKLLDAYEVHSEKHHINQDPVRRYFESSLCYQTLREGLDSLELPLLKRLFDSIYNKLTKKNAIKFRYSIQDGSDVNEYTEGIRMLDDIYSYELFKPEPSNVIDSARVLSDRKEKMKLLIKCVYCSLYVKERSDSGETLLDLYEQNNSVYASENRGRIRRIDPDTGEKNNRVRSHSLGILRNYMPLPLDDALYAEHCSRYTRSTDIHTYALGSHQIPDQLFSTKVTPFVNSISGTMLVILRVLAQLVKEHQWVYVANNEDEPGFKKTEQFKCFFKLMVAYLLYHTGGHSLDEYMQVLQLPEVQHQFKQLPGFKDLTLYNLFLIENATAFSKALKQTIKYNTIILNRKNVHFELFYTHHLIINRKITTATTRLAPTSTNENHLVKKFFRCPPKQREKATDSQLILNPGDSLLTSVLFQLKKPCFIMGSSAVLMFLSLMLMSLAKENKQRSTICTLGLGAMLAGTAGTFFYHSTALNRKKGLQGAKDKTASPNNNVTY